MRKTASFYFFKRKPLPKINRYEHWRGTAEIAGLSSKARLRLEWIIFYYTAGRVIKIQIKESWQPKTGERDILINDQLFKLLDQLHKKKNSSLVFYNSIGNKIHRNKLRVKLIHIAKKADIPELTKLHTLRHTFASHLVMKGVDLASVQKLMGHADIKTTMIYSHLAPEHLKGAVDKLSFG